MNRIIFPKLVTLALTALMISACGEREATQSVEVRAQARWDAVLAEEYETAYNFLSPGYRSSVKLGRYITQLARKPLGWVAARYLSKTCEEDVCEVVMDVDYRVARPVPGLDVWESTARVTETWLLVDGKWYLVPES